MGVMKKSRFLTALVTTLSILAMSTAPALAAKPIHAGGGGHGGHGGGGSTSTVLTGNDISWPQCGRRLPNGQAFGIVGVNGGLANQPNDCFAEELAWAQNSSGGTSQDNAALYVNTANPGDVLGEYNVTDWPTSGTTPYGDCDGSNSQACAYEYGKELAMADTQFIGNNDPASFKWWLDVETNNSWSLTNTANNVADLEGMTDYFQSLGARVGLYSTGYQWGQIVGNSVSSTSSLNGLDSWLAGASNLSDAQTQCTTEPALTNGGTVSLVQYISKRTDYDFSCK